MSAKELGGDVAGIGWLGAGRAPLSNLLNATRHPSISSLESVSMPRKASSSNERHPAGTLAHTPTEPVLCRKVWTTE